MAEAPVDPNDRVRTPLLALIAGEALEQDYQAAARRRERHAPPPDAGEGAGAGAGEGDGTPRSGSRLAVAVVLSCFGLLVAIAAVQTSRNADVEDAGRATLIDRIETRRETVRGLQERISDLRDENAESEADLLALGDQLNQVQAEVTRLAVVSGFEPVTGEGVRILLDNAPLADPETEYIRDSDLALLVNGLFDAGAEAITINGQRISSRTGIRISGAAIEVNSVGIAPPYTVLAIGDGDTLAADLLETQSGLAFAGLASQFGFSYDTDTVDDIQMPAAPQQLRELRFARQLTNGPRTPGGGSTP